MRWLADENLDGQIVKSFRKALPSVDLVRAQDVGLRSASDPEILEWAAAFDRVLLTHDAATMTDFAYRRIAAGLPMPGILEVRVGLPIGSVIEDLLLIEHCSEPAEWDSQVRYLPLR